MNRTKAMPILFFALILLMAFDLSPEKQFDKNEQILVSFEVKDKGQIDICNNFTINFVSDSKVYKSQVKDCILLIPKFPKKLKTIIIEFRFENYILKFDDIKTDWLNLNQKMNWNFKIDFPPFDEELNNETLNKEDLKMIYYFQFNPLERGEGIEIINPIY
ncbi:hypothetical protein [Psychroserpens sp. NJDZ02]|uniref:hypothetical protein n=1 Tax=Psychroserpens sp. NJDZ02 TaxID=2570561 RepID=UPI0010A7A0D3|nr:hypothetical protein [Psychroserpens sp. NJDZ02]QCE40241.1 hypothetical protein E9099_01985 [Psychroserpens sp. NJDZ02]